uniref:BPTI/Kunitz inhibitor domain-containing protein n=1 Tax=Megaselia scalaris TaxID=36166 RepID=T1GSQ8_MEGSC
MNTLCLSAIIFFGSVFLVYSQNSDCNLPLYQGPCKAYFKRYGFNSTLQKCVLFIYGGCGANGNNFEDLESCQAACEYNVKGICNTKSANYNKVKCEKFAFEMCGNFNTKIRKRSKNVAALNPLKRVPVELGFHYMDLIWQVENALNFNMEAVLEIKINLKLWKIVNLCVIPVNNIILI